MANETVKDNDELVDVREAGDYTIKIFRREDCKWFAVVVHETDVDSRVVGTTRAASQEGTAIEGAKFLVEKDAAALRKRR